MQGSKNKIISSIILTKKLVAFICYLFHLLFFIPIYYSKSVSPGYYHQLFYLLFLLVHLYSSISQQLEPHSSILRYTKANCMKTIT